MSSDGDSDRENSAKKQKVISKPGQRACDTCRRKKSDASQMDNEKCSNCMAYNSKCTFNEAARKRGPPKGYVEGLENRLEKMEDLLKKLCPDGDFSQELGGHFDRESWRDNKGPPSSSKGKSKESNAPSPVSLPTPVSTHGYRSPSEDNDAESSDDDVPAGLTLSTWLKELNVNPATPRFFGKSSGARLVKSAMAIKSDLTGVDPPRSTSIFMQEVQGRRPEYWNIHPWERKDLGTPEGDNARAHMHKFPEPDLLPQLIDRYFKDINTLFPVLHRPSFERSVAEGRHMIDHGFATLLLVVCSIGARYVEDPRVYLENATTHSAGWKYFNQVQMVRKSLLAPPRLYDVQLYCLATLFLQGSSAPQACWSIVGIGIRLAQDIGAHRRKLYDSKPSLHDELWKRAFWVLVSFDRGISAGLGRPCAIQDEDFDLDLPIDCDDEYWEDPDPEKAFQQPPGKPSKITFFISLIKLNQILAFALRTIYSINKSKVLLGFIGPEWEQNIVSELDSALNKWVDTIPDHLRWDPKREDETFFHQSAILYSSYYMLQVSIHRPFIPHRNKSQAMGLPALAMCTNAARSCSHVVDVHRQRRKGLLPMQVQVAAFTSGIILLLSIWGGKRGGVILDPAKEMSDVYRCMDVLKQCEDKWHIAGRFWDILWELASVSDLPLPTYNPGPVLKRDRENGREDGGASAAHRAQALQDDVSSRTIAGSRRVMASQSDFSSEPSAASTSGASYPMIESALYAQPYQQQQSQYASFSGHQPGLGSFTQPQQPMHQAYPPQSNHMYPAMYNSQLPTNPPPSMPHSTFNPQYGYVPGSLVGPSGSSGPSLDPATSWMPSTDTNRAFDQMVSGIFGAPTMSNTVPGEGPDPFSALDALIGFQPGTALPDAQSFTNDDPMSLWTNAPAGFSSEDWNAYMMGAFNSDSVPVQGYAPHGSTTHGRG